MTVVEVLSSGGLVAVSVGVVLVVSCAVCLSGSGGRGVCLCGSVFWGGRRSSHGVCLGEGDGCSVCLYGSGGHDVC